MEWAYTIRRKIVMALLLASVFGLLLAKNMVDNRYVSQLGFSFSTVYEDRLIVESYIYQLSDHLFRKKIMIDTSYSAASALDLEGLINSHNDAIQQIIIDYGKTRLTEAEHYYFRELQANIHEIVKLENRYFHPVNTDEATSGLKILMGIQFNKASQSLRHLSQIQVSEGKILNERSQKIIAGSFLLSYFELGILIAIGFMVVVLIFESKPLSVFPQNSHLN